MTSDEAQHSVAAVESSFGHHQLSIHMFLGQGRYQYAIAQYVQDIAWTNPNVGMITVCGIQRAQPSVNYCCPEAQHVLHMQKKAVHDLLKLLPGK